MASSSSSSSPRTWRYNVFTSFHGPDVRKRFLSHLRQQFNYNGITMFDDNRMERGNTIASSLKKAIGDSRIAIVLLSKNYASSSWCLDELLEIMKCKEELEQIVITVFHGVEPSDVRKQAGEFGKAFDKTCSLKTEEQRQKWSQALTYVGNIAGEDFKNWPNEAEMIQKIAKDVSNKLNATSCSDFDAMVGLDNHLREMESLLDLDNVGVKIVGISGPAGIGKSTIARALHSRLPNRFQHTCFVDNLKEGYKIGLDEYSSKLHLQKQLLADILKHDDIRVSNLGLMKQRLNDQKVLIILDDVESLVQLEALADARCFGPGSRVIVTTENKKLLQQHGITDIYQVGFPSKREALKIFCLSAFKQTFPPNGFIAIAGEVASICGNLPLGLHVLGTALKGKSLVDWVDELPRLKNCLDGRIESVLKVGYDSLDEKDQAMFLFIAVFFNHKHVDHVTTMLAKSNLNVSLGLKNLANRYLIHIDHGRESRVVMHILLQVMARQVIFKQKHFNRKILLDVQDICYALEMAKGTGATEGVSFVVAEVDELMINPMAFKRMCNLLFLKVYNVGCRTRKRKLHIPDDIEFPRRMRLFHWDAYQGRSLPLKFYAENLVEVNMKDNQLEKLWEGIQPLANLKKMILCGSSHLKELPDLSNAINLERLDVSERNALVEVSSSIANLRKISDLHMDSCKSLQVIPSLVNLLSLKWIRMNSCPKLTRLPDFPTHITTLYVDNTGVEELPASLRHFSCLDSVLFGGSRNLKTFFIQLPTSVTRIHLNDCGIEWIADNLKGLHNLTHLILSSCKRLVSLPELPCSLKCLFADDCISLERISGPLNTPNADLYFTDCIKLGRQAQRTIIQGSFVHGWALLPGREVPEEFDYRTIGNALTIHRSVFNRFKVCVVMSQEDKPYCMDLGLSCHWRVIGNSVKSGDMSFCPESVVGLHTKHLFIFHISLPLMDTSEVSRKIMLRFFSRHDRFLIVECGVQILPDRSNNRGCGDEDEDDLWDTHISEDEASYEEEKDDDSMASGTFGSESGEASTEEDSDNDSGDNYYDYYDREEQYFLDGVCEGFFDWTTLYELGDVSGEENDDSIVNRLSDSEASDKEDDNEGDKSE